MSVKAFTPAEAREKQRANFPSDVIEVINGLLATGQRTFTQLEIVTAISEKTGASASEIHERRWLDFESTYEAAGWHVVYDKADYNESGTSTFHFSSRDDR